jgi:3-O-methylgallate 3,4-dioxygenase
MADVVLGIGTSHGPMLVTETEQWGARLPADKAALHPWRGRNWTFEALREARQQEPLDAQVTEAAWNERQQRNQRAIEKLADIFAEAGIDVAVVVGNDQMEIFDEKLIPAFSVLYGSSIPNAEFSAERLAQLPPGILESIPGYIPPGGAIYPGEPDLAHAIIAQAMAEEFDVAAMAAMPKNETPHAFGFVYRRVMRDAPVPSVPILVNTFYPPNLPTARRCYDFGRAIAHGISNWDSDARVALVASGGLTHFVIDETVDRVFFDTIGSGDIDPFIALGEDIFQGGTSEMKNWVIMLGALAELSLEPAFVDYVPCYRSVAGTGNAMGFVHWQ